MKKTKTIEITIETDELFVLKGRNRSVQGRCETCGGPVHLVTLAEAASMICMPEFIWAEVKARFPHSIATCDGQVLVCLNSLRTEQP